MCTRIAFICVLLFSCGTACAQNFGALHLYLWTESRSVVLTEYEKYNRDGKEVQKHLNANDATNNGMFIGFVGGVADGLEKKEAICPSSDDPLSLYLFAVSEYVKKHPRPELFGQDAYKIVATVLIEKFACRSK